MFRSPAHLKLIRSLPCCYCGSTENVQAAHIRKHGGGGMGIKPGDDKAVPLDDRCHRIQHARGELTFWGGDDGVYKALEYAMSLVGMTKAQAAEATLKFRRTVIA